MAAGSISEVPPLRAEASGAIGTAAPTRVGAVLSCLLHGLAVLGFLAFGAMHGNAGAPDPAVAVELIQLAAPPPTPEPPQAAPQPQPEPKPAPPQAAPRPKRLSTPPLPAPSAPSAALPAAAPVAEAAPGETAAPSPPAAATVAAAPPGIRDEDLAAYQAMVWERVMAQRPARVRFGGLVRVRFALTPAGGLVSAEIAQSSGSAFLDRTALDAVDRAAPFPPPPAAAGPDQRTFVIPFHFR